MKQTIITVALCAILFACHDDDFPNADTLKVLYKEYKDGGISECTYEGEIVYTAGINAYDAPGIIFNADGEEIGECNYAFNRVDSICYDLQECTTIYMVKDNIWGEDAVDLYGLKH